MDDAKSGRDWLSVFRSRDFTLLWFGGLASYTGRWAMLIALPLFVYQQTNSTLASGTILTAQFAPMLLASVAGVLVDRGDRKRVLVTANVVMTALVLLLAIPASSNGVTATLWIVYVSASLIAVAGLVVAPAENSLLPTLVKPEQLLTANSMNALNDNLARIIGPAIGGAVAAFVGITGVIVLNAVTYAAAAVLIAMIRSPGRAVPTINDAAESNTAGTRGFFGEWLDGLRLVRASRTVVVIFVATAIVVLGDSMFSALLAPFVDQTFTEAAVVFGFIIAARGAGGLLGSVITGLLGRILTFKQRIAGTTVAAGAILAVLVLLPKVPVTLVAAGLLGVVAVVWGASIQTTIQASVPNAYLGRVFGSFGTTNAATMTLGSAIAAGAGGPVGIAAVLLVAAALYSASGIVTYLALPSGQDPIDR